MRARSLATNHVYAWTSGDYRVSRTMEGYFANFIKTGDPNGPGLPRWPTAGTDPHAPMMMMRIDVRSRAQRARHRERDLVLDSVEAAMRGRP